MAVVGVAGSPGPWQLPQSIEVATGMCGGDAMAAAAEFEPLWQLKQPDVMVVWLTLVASFHVVKPVGEWQLEQSAPAGIATWPGNDAVPWAPEVPWVV